jgi:hypothetical protein
VRFSVDKVPQGQVFLWVSSGFPCSSPFYHCSASEVCDSPYRTAGYHISLFNLRASLLSRYLTGYRVRSFYNNVHLFSINILHHTAHWNILSHIRVTVDRFWFDNWIYWTLKELHRSQSHAD